MSHSLRYFSITYIVIGPETVEGTYKMAAIVQTTFPDDFLLKDRSVFIQISLKFVRNGPINYKPSLVQIMVGAEQATSYYVN